MVRMRVIFLGTSSAVPTLARGLYSVALIRGSEVLLFDCGEGTQRQMLGAGLGFSKALSVFVTHMHTDHVFGLFGLLQTMSLNKRDKPVYVYGPKGIQKFIEQGLDVLQVKLSFDVEVQTIHEGVVLEKPDYLVRACQSKHSITSLSYLVEEKPRPGLFYPKKAIALGIPKGELWSTLQKGKDITIKKKKFIPSEVMGPSRPGRKIGISGDTMPSRKLKNFFTGADVLIHDSTYESQHKDKARENMHSTAHDAAIVARSAKVDLLVLNHFSARYSDVRPLLLEAMKIHPNVRAAADLGVLDIEYRTS
ncbi:MAG: ribonuclease Z [Nitrososphaerales archaeon]